MCELLQAILESDERTALAELIGELRCSDKQYFLRHEILQAFDNYCARSQKPASFQHASSLGKLVHFTHEILLEEESFWFLIRPRIASQEICWVAADLSSVQAMPPQALLDLRDRLVNRSQPHILEIDLQPFYETAPTIRDPRNIGQGLEFLNRYLCSKLFVDPQYSLDAVYKVLHERQYDGIPLLINDRIRSGAHLRLQVKQALKLVNRRSSDESYDKFRFELQDLGFEPGWGNTAARVRETMELLERFINTPEPPVLEALLSRIPDIFRIVLVSIHGWVAQENILGRPETAGQVVYVLEQARSLEARLRNDVKLAGLDILGIQPQVIVLTRLIPNCEGTQCNLQREKVRGTENAWILRVPFQEFNPNVTQNWISKFEIWPYLETFALDAEKELLAQLRGRPDLIIGNYSDGNLVAFLLARRLHAIQCNIAHALEKSKYLFSNLYWQDLEDQYHFSLQFTADLISMNAADFILTSSYHEIIGSPDDAGQYESYKCFTMPQLYHVVDGIELFSPKFNVLPPGVNEKIFFPYSQMEDRVSGDRDRVLDLLFKREDPNILGFLEDTEKLPILAFAPISSVKNFTGLVECFGQNKALRSRCNLILLTGILHASDATNPEQSGEIEQIHNIIDRYQLYNQIRWVGLRLTSLDLGEAYRAIADYRGIFLHCAFFEAFGLTLLESMISGLPTFATQFGGSSEIIQDGENGFHIDPTDMEATAQKILDFFDRCDADPKFWDQISERAIQRIRESYNWRFHTTQLLSLAKIYRFWNSVSHENREALLRYLETLFHLLYKPRTHMLLEQHSHR